MSPWSTATLTGTVTEVTFKGMHYDIIVDFKGFKWLIQTTDFSPVGARIGVKIVARRLPHHEEEPLLRYVRRLQLLQLGV